MAVAKSIAAQMQAKGGRPRRRGKRTRHENREFFRGDRGEITPVKDGTRELSAGNAVSYGFREKLRNLENVDGKARSTIQKRDVRRQIETARDVNRILVNARAIRNVVVYCAKCLSVVPTRKISLLTP